MCGRFVTIIPYDELKKIFDLVESQNRPEPRYNVAPTQQVPVVRNTGEVNELVPMKWGLIPSWAKDSKIANHTINARCESVAEKPSFRHAIKVQRCIVPTSGFYEWSHAMQPKVPFFIEMADQSAMCFAGIWEHWKDADGSPVETFSILTTTANELVAPIHDRMPVILAPENFGFWLDKEICDPHQLERLYQPFPADKMSFYQVPTLVNNPKFDSPACIAKV